MKDIQHTHSLAVLALKGAREAVEARSTPAQITQLQLHLEAGAQLALAIRQVNGVAHIELAVIPAGQLEFFANPLLRFDGPAIAALASPGAVSVFDRAKLN